MDTTTLSLRNFFENAIKSILITDDRKQLLYAIANQISKEYDKNGVVNLNFICTHNSRRSQLGQVWSYFASEYFGMNINAFSGGTEATAFYKNTVKTLQSVGFIFDVLEMSHENPKYSISFENSSKSIVGFSKTYDDVVNQQPFIVITTCNNADENCPFIPEASNRFHLPFVDPKHSDGSEKEAAIYLETNQQIASEVFIIFTEVCKILS